MKKILRVTFCLACLTLIFVPGWTLRAAKYPPGLHWREIGRGNFTVIFPAERWQQADAALASAENAFEKLAAFWRERPAGRIRIVLDDCTDDANGFATFFPFNLVGVNLSEPPPDGELAVSDSWLDLVLTHELVHIFTMHSAAEPFRILRRVFGSQPVLYPAVQLPPWVVEGLAVWGESRFTGDGRLNHPPYPLMLDAARRDNLFPGWGPISGTPAAWPGPSAKYLFGAGFMEFLAEKYGPESLGQYLRRATSRMILFSSNRDFEKTFGEPLGNLWEKYQKDPPAASGPPTAGQAFCPLSDQGFSSQYPCSLGENGLVYYHRDYRGRGAVEMLDPSNGRKKILCRMDAVNGLSFAEKENILLISAVEKFHASNDFSDLFELDIAGRKLKRLSHGQRLSQPVKMKGSDKIFCVQRRNGRFSLAVFDRRRRTVQTIGPAFTGLSQLSLSPQQDLIAAAVKPDGGPWGIGVFSASGELRAFFTAAGANLRQPVWQNERTLYCIHAGSETTRLASLSLEGGQGRVCDDPRLSGLQQFCLDPGGPGMVCTYFSGRGREIARFSIEEAHFSPLEISMISENFENTTASTVKAPPPSRPYRFWRDLLPRWWTPAWRLAGDEFQAGIITGGQDALGIHSYSLEGYFGFSSRRASYSFLYVYDGLFPTLSFAYADNTDRYREDEYSWRSQELKLASLWPLRIRRRSQLYGYADLHLGRRSYWNESGSNENIDDFNGIRMGLEFNSAREYYDSISPADGVRLALQYSIQPAAMGNEFTSRSAQLDLRHYIPLFRPGVLAWRLALAQSWDDPYGFTLGGPAGESGSILGKSHPFDLLRGFPAGYDRGKGGYLFNLEYRLPLFKIEKVILPALSLDRVYVNAFFDMGHLWHGTYSDSAMYSVGTELVLRLAFGGAAAYDVCFGAARGFGPERQWQAYVRMGRSF